VTTPSSALQRPAGLVTLRWAIGVVLFFGLMSCVVKGADNPADPFLASPSSGASSRTGLAGFEETRVTVTTGASVLEWCMLLAQTEQQRARGLMEVTDPALGGYDGMVFRYDTDVNEQYWMRNTRMPLSIAYVDSAGQLVSAVDMAPCEDSPDCQDYPAAGPYRTAIEVPQGKLPSLGIVQGATIVDDKVGCG
jgi:uncharacterized membrane protein (UPF0127 family)